MTIRDLLQLGKIIALTLIAWCVPPRFWRNAAATTGRFGGVDRCWPVYEQILGQKFSRSEIVAISARRHIYRRELKLQILGLNGPWRRWRPDIRLNGEVHLRIALERAHGAILWVLETSFSTLIVKMALHNAGYSTVQLSRAGHGFSNTFFGIRFLNKIWTRVENRFIAERVVIVGENANEAMRLLRTRLAKNGIVIITVASSAHKFASVPFFNKQLELPTGPIRLALATGATLLPVFAVTEANGEFEVSIEEPLYPSSNPATIEDIAAAYAKRLEPFVLKHPDQWTGWDWLGGRMRPRPSC